MKTNKALTQLYQLTDKQQTLTDLINSVFAKTLSMFAYEGLPDTVNRVVLEKSLQMNGYVVFFQYQGKLYFANAGLTGQDKSPYNEPTQAIINVPALGLNQTLTLNENCVLVQNDDLRTGLYSYIKKYGTLLVENEITMLLNTYNDRIVTLISAGTDQSITAANNYISNIIAGNIGTIAENSFLKDLTVHNAQSQGKVEFADLIQYQQYLKSELYNLLGLSSLNNMKKERLISSEVEAGSDNIFPLVDSMLSNRIEGINMVNKLFNGNIKVDFNGTWKDKSTTRTNPNASKVENQQPTNKVDEPVQTVKQVKQEKQQPVQTVKQDQAKQEETKKEEN